MLIEATETPEIEKETSPLDGATVCMNALLEENYKRGCKLLLLLSGGSSLDILHGLNSDFMSNDATISPLDERYSINPEDSNMSQIDQTEFFKKSRENGANFIDTRVTRGESQESLTNRYNEALVEWIKNNPDGKIFATVGVGQDGHVSGIMPFPEEPQKFHDIFDDKDSGQLVVGYDSGDKNEYPLRVTTTMNLIRKIDAGACYVVGENKKDAVTKLLASEGDIATTPARILREIEGKVFLFTDQV